MQESQSVVGVYFTFQNRVAFYKLQCTNAFASQFVILVEQHPNRDICYLHLMVYRMQPLDLRGAMGTKKTMKPVKHLRRLLNTKKTMKDYQIY